MNFTLTVPPPSLLALVVASTLAQARAPNAELIAGDIGYRTPEGGHRDPLDRPEFLKVAGKSFGTPPK